LQITTLTRTGRIDKRACVKCEEKQQKPLTVKLIKVPKKLIANGKTSAKDIPEKMEMWIWSWIDKWENKKQDHARKEKVAQ